ncbi:MAG TPA: 2-amino-4-hydroxy-6-hydroxymethyldihydropteridine diphosphokinase [Lentisphaeria bacterium]|nr:2-amino-4-hydroxy-6-hydroxymethyldihydropteridine diphosphokinase [Lentisphaerota bacterium]OQC14660.1 MAG: 2-amino-4-hydroxy-6-hydroxymethyldihydropteridine pyrophosphokinase [Lentisphaerae bacterium ADurb.Bin082]HQC51811.1 2-amino-4-hydroxy-6-hydroxymethyldihydropteridine diphosphokinase [Lentisphaeria bacterium]HQL88073.1 2-amino-4-hydroxy-6-hydroxymethyldihydropteridine diphosphokinase [Lentisphaeria bacterium]
MNETPSSSSSSHRVAIALGGNLGDTVACFERAMVLLAAGGVRNIRQAPLFITTPVDCEPGTPDFVNSALTASWGSSPEELLRLCQTIEQRLGRPAKHSSRESRIIDLDLLLFDTLSLVSPNLTIPHPRLRSRRFVLEPLAQIAPDWPVPPDGQTVQQLLLQLTSSP